MLQVCGYCYCFKLLPTQSDGQAWTKEKGKTYVKLSYGSSTASEQYSFDGQTKEYADNVSENAFFDRSLYLYGEMGLTPKLTLVAGIPFKRVIVRDATFRYRTFALGNAVIGARYNLKSLLGVDAGSEAIAANFSLSLPTGYSRNLTPSVGSGQIDAELNASPTATASTLFLDTRKHRWAIVTALLPMDSPLQSRAKKV